MEQGANAHLKSGNHNDQISKETPQAERGCHVMDYIIDFREGEAGDKAFFSRVLHPQKINIRKCVGRCTCIDGSCAAEGTGVDMTSHARFKGLIR